MSPRAFTVMRVAWLLRDTSGVPRPGSSVATHRRRAWKAYAPAAERDNDSWATDQGRAKHLLRHLGSMQADRLPLKDVDAYRDARLKEKTQRGTPPTPATLDREVELLKRLLGYAVKSGQLKEHPLRDVQLLRKPNVRRMVLDENGFQRLFAAAEEALRPILLPAFDTGMRKEELLALRWEQVSRGEHHRARARGHEDGRATGHRPHPACQGGARRPPLSLQEGLRLRELEDEDAVGGHQEAVRPSRRGGRAP